MRRPVSRRSAGRLVFAALFAGSLWWALPPVGPSASQPRAAGERATVSRVIDGDTLVVVVRGRSERVRLLGVDTPEIGAGEGGHAEYLAREAREFARGAALGERVVLESDRLRKDRDDYGRLLRYVGLPDGRVLNGELIRRGYGYAFTRYPFTRQGEFERLEAEARDRGVGLWAEGGLAELRWNLEQGYPAVRLFPTSNRSWAIEYAGRVKPRVRASRLISELNGLRRLVARHPESELPRLLEAEGYVALPRPRDGGHDGGAGKQKARPSGGRDRPGL